MELKIRLNTLLLFIALIIVAIAGYFVFTKSVAAKEGTGISYENGKQIIEIDSPSFLGGSGNRLGPMGYCVAGITSCFIATFVSIISTQGIKLEKLNVNAECNINFAKTFDAADEPITEGINFEIDVRTAGDKEADKQKLQELVKMAEDRSPAIYSMSHVINVNAKIK